MTMQDLQPSHCRVKICGLTRPQDVELAIEEGASFLGFIVEAASKRRVSLADAITLAAPAQGIVPRVAVTVNADDNLLRKICADMKPDYIQCHGDESPQHVAEISKLYGIKTIKAVPVGNAADMKTATPYHSVADILLYDARPPKDTNIRGGHGLSFDWSLLETAPKPDIWALAGGLTPGNVSDALTQTMAPIIDVSSGIEAAPGLKDPTRLKAFMKAIRNG